jgi:poly-gamma-glutamate capsule biosynthesis protein CapA/YwtB (metallophosphatase superfamily)
LLIRKKTTIAVSALILIAAIGWFAARSRRREPPGQLRGSGNVLTIAATGDWITQDPLPSEKTDHSFAEVATILRNASMAVTNLEENLLNETPSAQPESSGAAIRFPRGSETQAKDLKKIGMTVVSLANNHAIDYGPEGLKQTRALLHNNDLLQVGSGNNLEEAGAAVNIGNGPSSVSIIAVTTSASAESRATYTEGEISGRPGVNVLRYSPQVTVDHSSFAILKKSPFAKQMPADGTGQNRLTLSGTVITEGDKSTVAFVRNDQDAQHILNQVKQARLKSNIVVVMLHSHEPSNQSEAPADFVQAFARELVESGAQLVVGSGPHRLRGIEVHHQGVICYSLGNFALDYNSIGPRAVDVFDSGIDLYQQALGTLGNIRSYPVPLFEEPLWWESVVAVATFKDGLLESIRLHPIDLGLDLPLNQRGTPRSAKPERGGEILRHLEEMSRNLGTKIQVQNGTGYVELGSSSR